MSYLQITGANITYFKIYTTQLYYTVGVVSTGIWQ